MAVWPPPSLVSGLRDMDRAERPGLRWTTEEQWHVTLRFLGSVDASGKARLREALAEVAAVARQAGPVEASAGPQPRALGDAVWMLPVAGLEGLAGQVIDATRDIGRPPPHRPFRGHVTLARARHARNLAGLAASPLSETWEVGELTLVRSDLRSDGARYHVVGRWPLGHSV